MKKNVQFILLFLLFLSACNTPEKQGSIEKWKTEIVDTEREFAAMAQKEGISKAFLTYAADDAVLMRNNSLLIGKEALKDSYRNNKTGEDQGILVWKPDFVDVAKSGDLGYTYGKYTYTSTDSLGKTKVAKGIFHTVWKRQADGKWKFVWD